MKQEQLFTKEGIIRQLNTAVQAFEQTGKNLNDQQFFAKSEGLWSAAEQMQHLVLAIKPLNKAYGLPRLILRFMYGKPTRNASTTYQELVKRYQGKLERGAKSSAAFIPKPIAADAEKDALINHFNKSYTDFTSKIEHINEYDLDNYQLPHPILGKLTLREMLYFTAYHVEHHHKIVKERIVDKVTSKR